METFKRAIDGITSVVQYPLFTLGAAQITLWTFIYLIGFSIALVFVTGKVRLWLEDGVLARQEVELGTRRAIGAIVRYLLLGLGFVVVVQSAGIDLSALTVLAGAVGIGLGFGLQTIISNFVSGLIILFERPIKVGDRVDVGNVRGNVVKIAARATTIVTNDNIAIIVPNAEFISQRVVNWSYTDPTIRITVPVGVAYGTDPDLVRRALLDVASRHDGVLADPKSDVMFEEFGDSSLNFALRVWTTEFATKPGVLRSELNYLIADMFRQENIQIPFPQRDVHIKSGSLVPDGVQ